MKVLLDTNVIVDAIAAREPFRHNAEAIFRLIKSKRITAFITANSVTDIYYLARKSRGEAETRQALRILFDAFQIIDVRARDCRDSLDFPLDDYEDALLLVCGNATGVDYLITRDERLIHAKNTGMEVLAPDAFLKEVLHSPR